MKRTSVAFSFMLSFLLAYSFLSEAVHAAMFEYEEVKPFSGVDIPGLVLREKNFAAYCALQFGPGKNDVLYLVLDCEKEYGRHDKMYAYIPEHSLYSNPVLIKGSKTSSQRSAFKKLSLTSTFEELKIMCELRLFSETKWENSKIDLDFEMLCRCVRTADKKKCSFLVKGTFIPVMYAHTDIEVRRVLEKPKLNVKWDHRSAPPAVKGRIEMNAYGVVPQSGFKKRARVIVMSADGKSRMSKSIRYKPTGVRSEFRYKPPKRMKDSKPYKVDVAVDLEPFFGMIAGESVTVKR